MVPAVNRQGAVKFLPRNERLEKIPVPPSDRPPYGVFVPGRAAGAGHRVIKTAYDRRIRVYERPVQVEDYEFYAAHALPSVNERAGT